MSITFSLRTATGGFVCTTDHGVCTVAEHLLDEDIALYSMPGYCVECAMVGPESCPTCSLDVNMSNANAAQVITALGLEFDYCGSIDPADLLGRALTSGVTTDDSGVAAFTDGGPGTGMARATECGLRPGYFAERFGALADLATVAVDCGYRITWG